MIRHRSQPTPRAFSKGLALSRPALALGLALTWATTGFGQEAVAVLRTGENPPLTSLVRPLDIHGEFALTFDFGFATDEVVEAEAFLDSVTATLQAENDFSLTAIVVTLDATGAYWAPATPGTLALVSDSITHIPVQMPDLFPMPQERQYGFRVTVPLPPELQNREVNFFLDLFDNGNSVASLAWLGNVQPVPEPGASALALAGAAFWLLRRKGNR